MAEPTQKRIIIVAGVEYPRFKDESTTVRGKRGRWWVLKEGKTRPHRSSIGSDWRRRGVDLAKLRLKADPTALVFLYDFDRGTVERVTLVKSSPKFDAIKQKFPPMVDSDYRWVDDKGMLQPITGPVSTTVAKVRPFIRYFPQVSTISTGPVEERTWLKKFEKTRWDRVGMSIRHVYRHVGFIGKNHPGTLRELHLFGHASSSHGASSGTVFVNTNSPTPGRRHPLDLDARANLDFTSASINRTLFRKAFASDALSQVWGCNWHRPVRELVRLTAKQLKAKKLKTLPDSMILSFTWSDPGVGGNKWDFEAFFEEPVSPLPTKGKPKPITIKRDGKFVRRKLTELMDKTYMQKLADASGACVVGGLPGTYSNYDKTGSPRLTHVPTGHYGTGDVFVGQGVLNFYRQILGVKFSKGSHPTYGRGFGIYCPK